MSKYAKFIVEDPVDDKMYISGLMTAYFDNPKLTKIEDKENGLSIYAGRVRSGLIVNRKYLFVFATSDNYPIGTQVSMSNLNWVSIQTRTLQKEIKCGNIDYSIKKSAPYNGTVTLKEKTDTHYTYTSQDLPKLSIILLVDNSNVFEYPTRGTITSCIETFNTLIYYN